MSVKEIEITKIKKKLYHRMEDKVDLNKSFNLNDGKME